MNNSSVMAAQAAIHELGTEYPKNSWMPACAGMTRCKAGRRLLRPSVLAAALALAACAADGGMDAPSGSGFGGVATDSLSPYYTPSTVTYAVQGGTMPAVVIGNPFTGPEQPVDETVRAALRMPGWAPNARFVADANADAGKGFRVVLVLNPANPNLNANALCGVDPVATVSGGPFMIWAAFCQDVLPLSSASVRCAAPSGRTDPAFTQAVNLIFPFAEPRTVSVQ